MVVKTIKRYYFVTFLYRINKRGIISYPEIVPEPYQYSPLAHLFIYFFGSAHYNI